MSLKPSVTKSTQTFHRCSRGTLVGGDLVEVSPPHDPSGNTALIGANLLYEMLCALPGVPRKVAD